MVAFEQKQAEFTGASANVNLKITRTVKDDKTRFYTWASHITANEQKREWKISADGRWRRL